MEICDVECDGETYGGLVCGLGHRRDIQSALRNTCTIINIHVGPWIPFQISCMGRKYPRSVYITGAEGLGVSSIPRFFQVVRKSVRNGTKNNMLRLFIDVHKTLTVWMQTG